MRLIIVSNRLPVLVAEEKGRLELKGSVGGVSGGLETYLNSLSKTHPDMEYLWVGWPGLAVERSRQQELRDKLKKEKLHPVFLTQDEVESFYNGFCNETIWPLFHYFPSFVSFKPEQWDSYRQVNEVFLNELVEVVRPGDFIWMHDYQLMLLPRLVRDRLGGNYHTGFFLHIPFPVYEVFRLLPDKWRRAILNGILGADLVGFHTYEYTRYFKECVQQVLGYDYNIEQIIKEKRGVKVDTFPLGIDYKKYHDASLSPKVQKEMAETNLALSGRKVILSIDRLDYTKGIVKRLESYEMFLQKYPEWKEKVELVMVVVPSRTGVERYQDMKQRIDELVGKINGNFGNTSWAPIIYQYKSLSFEQLAALYSLSHVALVTPLRDGMNLVAKEYIASRRDRTGVLILSETAGTAQELGEALIINPNHIEEIAGALKVALEMPVEKQMRSNEGMQLRLSRYNVIKWGDDFTRSLVEFKKTQKSEIESKAFGSLARSRLLKDFGASRQRLLLLDYDGTLVPFVNNPQLARPGPELLSQLSLLARVSGNDVVLISGRDRTTLESWFTDRNLALVAEHGVWIREKNQDWKMTKKFSNRWKKEVMSVLKIFSDRVPGTFIEEKDYSLVWHYRMANPELAKVRAQELIAHLLDLLANKDIQILPGNKVVEVKNAGIGKNSATQYFLDKLDYGFVLGMGDDVTDEDMFKTLPKKAYSIKVGLGKTEAKYLVDGYQGSLDLIGRLLGVKSIVGKI